MFDEFGGRSARRRARELERSRVAEDGIPISDADVSGTPTDAEIDAAFGTPSEVGAGFVGIIDDAGAGSQDYIVASDGTNWWYASLTKAT